MLDALIYEIEHNIPDHFKWLLRSAEDANGYFAHIYTIDVDGVSLEYSYRAWAPTIERALNEAFKQWRDDRFSAKLQ
jgi:hypothetical protein